MKAAQECRKPKRQGSAALQKAALADQPSGMTDPVSVFAALARNQEGKAPESATSAERRGTVRRKNAVGSAGALTPAALLAQPQEQPFAENLPATLPLLWPPVRPVWIGGPERRCGLCATLRPQGESRCHLPNAPTNAVNTTGPTRFWYSC